MPAWGFYKQEAEFYKDDFRFHLPLFRRERIQQFTEEVCKYYDIVIPKITYRGISFHRCVWEPPRLNFIEYEITLGIFAHEMAHHVENQLNQNHRHNKQFARRVEEILSWLYDFVLTEKDRLGMKTMTVVDEQ